MSDEGRVVLITGATGPLGRAAAASFAAGGARLGLVGRDAGRLDALAADLALAPGTLVTAVADMTDGTAASEAVAIVEHRLGRVDIVLHLVGGWTGGTAIADLDPTVLAEMLDRHVWSTFHVARAVVPGMVERRWGRIVAVTSSLTSAPIARSGAYLTAKAGQETLLRVLAREVAGTGVTVNTIAVTTIDAAHEREREPSARNASWATPEEIVATLRHLCSEDGAALNGVRIPLDGRR